MEKIADLHENERSFPFQLSLEHAKPIVAFALVQRYEFLCVGLGGGVVWTCGFIKCRTWK